MVVVVVVVVFVDVFVDAEFEGLPPLTALWEQATRQSDKIQKAFITSVHTKLCSNPFADGCPGT